MEIKNLLKRSRSVWGNERLELSQIIIRMGKVFGNICKWERNEHREKNEHNDEELKKEMGNIIFSTIRWCDDLGYDPEECISVAIAAQNKYVSEKRKNK